MKNKVKLQISTIALAVLIVPSLTYAAWWNPATWFKKPTVAPKTVQISTTTPPTKPVVATPAPVVKKRTPAVEKPVATPPVRTNDQAAEIEKLKKQIEELKKQQVDNKPPVIVQPTVPATVVSVPPPENILLKIERCKVEFDKKLSEFDAALDRQARELKKARRQKLEAQEDIDIAANPQYALLIRETTSGNLGLYDLALQRQVEEKHIGAIVQFQAEKLECLK